MLNLNRYEQLFLIGKLIDSYRYEYNIHDEKWLGAKFDKLYEMDISTLRYMADIRGILHIESVEV